MTSEVATEASWVRKSLFWVFKKSVKPLMGMGIGGRFPVARKIFVFLFRLLNPRLILIEVDGIKLYLDSKSSMAHGLIVNGIKDYFEKGIPRLFTDLIKEGMVILDIGAYIGEYSLITARLVGEKGKVFAFEPAPDNFAVLLKNIEVNGFSNIIPVPKAVSNKTGKGRLFLSNEPTTHSMYEHHEKGSIEVEVTSIDEFMENINCPVDLVKMDVEGWEMRVLEGMLETIRRNPDLKIITEFYPDDLQKSGCSPEGFLEKLMDCGFEPYLIDEETRMTKLADVNSIMEACQRRRSPAVNLYCDRQG